MLGSFAMSDPEQADRSNEFLRIGLLYGPTSFLSSLVLFLSTKKIAMIELLTPVMLISEALVLILI